MNYENSRISMELKFLTMSETIADNFSKYRFRNDVF